MTHHFCVSVGSPKASGACSRVERGTGSQWAPELEEHAALLLALGDHLEGVQATVAAVAVPAAEGDQGAVEAVVPGAVLVHVPQAVLVGAR